MARRYGRDSLGEEAMGRWASAADVSPARSSVNRLYGEERRKVGKAVECWSGKKAPRPVLQVRKVSFTKRRGSVLWFDFASANHRLPAI
jgi:hypothetical protein